jgi:phage FluMu protein Com
VAEKKIRCECGKLLAVERDGRIYIRCRGCHKQIEIVVIRSGEQDTSTNK